MPRPASGTRYADQNNGLFDANAKPIETLMQGKAIRKLLFFVGLSRA